MHEQLPVDHDDGDAAGVELKTPKQKRKRPQHQTNQSGWPIRPRTYWPVSDDVALSRSTMKNIIKDLSASEFSEYFLSPVDLGEAPGYLELIETPMDLSKSTINHFFTCIVYHAHIVSSHNISPFSSYCRYHEKTYR